MLLLYLTFIFEDFYFTPIRDVNNFYFTLVLPKCTFVVPQFILASLLLYLPKKAERHKSGLEKAMGKRKGGKKPPKMKRRRCAICAKWNHKMEDCLVLTRRKNDNELTTISPTVGVEMLAGATTVEHVTGGGTMDDNGQEGAL